MRDIRASAEVKELAGLDTLRELEGDAFERHDGWRCGGPGRTTDPVMVVVPGYQSTAIVKFGTLDARNRRLWARLLIGRQSWKRSG